MDAEVKAAREHLVEYGVPPAWVETARLEGAGEPGIFDLTGKSYTAAKMRDLFGLQGLEPAGDLPDGADIVVRLGEATDLKSP